jgi:division protein CdvB (Snf7/Vps24/ESCRT-III family)
MALFVLLFMLGVSFGMLTVLGIAKAAKKSFGEKDSLERSLKELEIGFKHLDQKYIDLHMEVEQMRSNLAKNSFSGLPKVKDKLDELLEEYKLDKRYNKENFQQLTNSIGSLRERLYNNNEGKSY